LHPQVVPLFTIGIHKLTGRALLAPMAGVTDLPFRELCRSMGAALAPSEMVTSNPQCRNSQKTQRRLDHRGESSPRSVQIVGADATQLASAAAYNVARGADIIDINMGCPAKKVCKKAAGSALLRDERQVERILQAVVAAVATPVTLKIRTGWDKQSINAPVIARIAEDCGIQALSVHGRTRACGFKEAVEYDTIACVVESVEIPVIANGDIHSAPQALAVLEHTGAAGVMIGRAAQGNPWIFSDIERLLTHGVSVATPTPAEVTQVMRHHLDALHEFYGPILGVRIARKHIGWYLNTLGASHYRRSFNSLQSTQDQRAALTQFTEQLTLGETAA
jgi:tRNA-dihydrouridine synthase B